MGYVYVYMYTSTGFMHDYCSLFFSLDFSNCKTVPGGPKEQAPCKFPVIFKGKWHDECIWEKNEEKPWCSTKTNKKGFHVGGQNNWGYCGPNCPFSGRGKFLKAY